MPSSVNLGIVGAGRMGAGIVRRLLAASVPVAITDVDTTAVQTLASEGAAGFTSIADMVQVLPAPRAVWVMVPAGGITHNVITELAGLLSEGDVIIDGGNSRYVEAIEWTEQLRPAGIDFLDVGTSGGVWGRERGFCLMIGGPEEPVRRLEPVWNALSPGVAAAPRTSEDTPVTPAERGWLHCGPSGAGHFVKMIHNGIEYGAMAAYAEGLNILAHANAGAQTREMNAETAPLANPEHYQYEFDLAAITEVWRRGSVVASWLLDLTAAALSRDPQLAGYQGRVSDSGEGRWTVDAAVDIGVPAPVLAASLFSRFASRDNDEMANKVLSAMRHAFGGHLEQHHG
ncbi:MAG: decarboxylating 6-phosphogluconate dehydrogenase [Actinobacteria bacterium]|nr:decarboxylating 6-phosphogluconate dehydrogenase [Actinomycetota bacterium]